MPDELTLIENESIRKFVQQAADDGYLSGRVLDYGAGKSPYRDVVETAGGVHVPFDRADFPANVSGADLFTGDLGNYQRWDTILCTQVVQYVPIEQDTDEGDGLQGMLSWLCSLLQWYDMEQKPPRAIQRHGHLVMTGPGNWPEVQEADLHRFTKAGIERLLSEVGFEEIVRLEDRAGFEALGYHFSLGWGVIARA